MENIFNSLCSLLLLTEIQDSFRKMEGIELLLIVMKKKVQRKSAIKSLNYALLNNQKSIDRFIEKKGVNTLFPVFMATKTDDFGGI